MLKKSSSQTAEDKGVNLLTVGAAFRILLKDGNMTTMLKGKDILHVKDLKLEQIITILETAARFENVMNAGGSLL